MDFMLEEELIDLFTACMDNPAPSDLEQKKERIAEIGSELHADGGVDAMVNFFFAVRNRVHGETGLDPTTVLQFLWDDIDPQWADALRQLPSVSDE